MVKLKETKKITLATLKSFAKRNIDTIYSKEMSAFDGMTDCVENIDNPQWNKSEILKDKRFYETGIKGIYTVGDSRDYFVLYEDDKHIGIEVYNCCGRSILAINK